LNLLKTVFLCMQTKIFIYNVLHKWIQLWPWQHRYGPYLKSNQDRTHVVSNVTSVTSHWLPFVTHSLCNKPKVRFVHGSNHTEHNWKWYDYLAWTTHKCIQPNVFSNGINHLLLINTRLCGLPMCHCCQGQTCSLHWTQNDPSCCNLVPLPLVLCKVQIYYCTWSSYYTAETVQWM
jgi:hypothetical protein